MEEPALHQIRAGKADFTGLTPPLFGYRCFGHFRRCHFYSQPLRAGTYRNCRKNDRARRAAAMDMAAVGCAHSMGC
jgi:hypothetical protein